MPLAEQQHSDDAHGLLCVIAAVAERIERGGNELHDAEGTIHGEGCLAHEQPGDGKHQQQCQEKPMAGDMKIAPTVFRRPDQTMELKPTFAKPAPTRPPIKACDELEGMPKIQVTIFQTMAPINAAKMTCGKRWPDR